MSKARAKALGAVPGQFDGSNLEDRVDRAPSQLFCHGPGRSSDDAYSRGDHDGRRRVPTTDVETTACTATTRAGDECSRSVRRWSYGADSTGSTGASADPREASRAPGRALPTESFGRSVFIVRPRLSGRRPRL